MGEIGVTWFDVVARAWLLISIACFLLLTALVIADEWRALRRERRVEQEHSGSVPGEAPSSDGSRLRVAAGIGPEHHVRVLGGIDVPVPPRGSTHG